MFKRYGKHGQSVVEFTAVILLILATFVIFQKYIVRGFSGRWKQVGDAIGQGKLYDPYHTIECNFDPTTGVWFDQECYKASCQAACFPTRGSGCSGCLISCQSGYCAP